MQKQHGFSVDAIKSIRIETFHEAKRLGTKHPKSTEEAQYSLPFSVAAALVHGTIGAQHIADDALDNPAVGALQDLIDIDELDEFNAVFPEHRVARAHLLLKDGSVLVSEPTEARGDPENPVGPDVIADKFMGLVAPVLGATAADNLMDLITGLKSQPDCRELLAALARAQN